tara:strand:- start:689 stop:1696 length:1008 start_codon:yes stop_codon:yes gene_type:complete
MVKGINNRYYIIYTMVKYLVGILCSSNIRLLRETLNSVINQTNFDDYHIFIIVNTLDEVFYQDVIREFGHNKHEKLKKIIRTESNGFAGKGHNSVLEVFYNNYQYDNLIKLDGDDFLFPCAIERINMVQTVEKSDVITLIGNCSITNTGVVYNKKRKLDTNTNTQILEYNINLGFEIQEAANIGRFHEELDTLNGTPLRLLCVNRKILVKYKKLYNEDMYKCVDIEYCVIFCKELHNPEYKITHLSDPYIYLYNGINEDSVSIKYNNNAFTYANDERVRDGLLAKYKLDEYKISIFKPVIYQQIIKDNVDMETIHTFYDNTLFTLMRINNQYIRP